MLLSEPAPIQSYYIYSRLAATHKPTNSLDATCIASLLLHSQPHAGHKDTLVTLTPGRLIP
jgi:hypothetical protein